ncbi:hypothetical protein IPJ72_04725 [Candidatus Peregrinibacteria bacterium]|nr:MAG: hypothetical protein IPJ72_04725 [Candidatus Peregrinibacteria bacterium]
MLMWSVFMAIEADVLKADSMDHFVAKSSHLPALNFFKKKEFSDLKRLAKRFRGKKIPDSFFDYYWSTIVLDSNVKQAAGLYLTDDHWDHDTAAFMAPAATCNTIRSLSTQKNSPTMLGSMYPALLRSMQSAESTETQRQLVANFIMLHGCQTKGRAYPNVKPIQGERFYLEDHKDESPRLAAILGDNDQSLNEINQSAWSLIKPLEPKLFALLEDSELSFDNLKNYLNKRYSINIGSFDDFYNQIEAIFQKILSKRRLSKTLKSKGFFGSIRHWLSR